MVLLCVMYAIMHIDVGALPVTLYAIANGDTSADAALRIGLFEQGLVAGCVSFGLALAAPFAAALLVSGGGGSGTTSSGLCSRIFSISGSTPPSSPGRGEGELELAQTDSAEGAFVKTVVTFALAANAAFGLAFACASTTAVEMICFRLLMGVSHAVFAVYAPCWVDAHAPASTLARWMSWLQGGVPTGVVGGYILAGYCAVDLSWHWSSPYIIRTIALTPFLACLVCLVPSQYFALAAGNRSGMGGVASVGSWRHREREYNLQAQGETGEAEEWKQQQYPHHRTGSDEEWKQQHSAVNTPHLPNSAKYRPVAALPLPQSDHHATPPLAQLRPQLRVAALLEGVGPV